MPHPLGFERKGKEFNIVSDHLALPKDWVKHIANDDVGRGRGKV